jgi:enamine deaminase RidA (YjgF/YER057c/UK114 family)
MKHTIHDIGVASQIGKYGDAVEASLDGRLLVLSGTPGLTEKGLPKTFEEQANQAWKNVMASRKHAGMGPEHLFKVTQYLTRSEDIKPYVAIRSKWMGDHRPASMLFVVPALVWPDILIEIEALAVAPKE